MQRIEANIAVSVSDLKKNPSAVIDSAEGTPIAVLNHNRVMAYMIPADTYEAIMDHLDDLELAGIIKSRAHEKGVLVDIDEL